MENTFGNKVTQVSLDVAQDWIIVAYNFKILNLTLRKVIKIAEKEIELFVILQEEEICSALVLMRNVWDKYLSSHPEDIW